MAGRGRGFSDLFDAVFFMSDPQMPSGQRSPDEMAKSRAVIAGRRRKVWFIVATVTCLIFAAIGGFLWRSNSGDAAVMAQGHVWTTAQVAEKETRRYLRNGVLRYDYFFHLAFTDEAGGPHTVRKAVGVLVFQDTVEGQSLPLRYAVADPTIVELQEGDLQDLSHWTWWVMVGGLAGAVLLVLAGLVQGRRARAD